MHGATIKKNLWICLFYWSNVCFLICHYTCYFGASVPVCCRRRDRWMLRWPYTFLHTFLIY